MVSDDKKLAPRMIQAIRALGGKKNRLAGERGGIPRRFGVIIMESKSFQNSGPLLS